ncbi:MAG: tRNA (guanosine(37)-N1)-methyltransferase TrmD [Propionibacteriaceae bacterium]|nr:tRNA (guanosine(37)-N1)-methyltransferase TrmD [Propionibacteriaceae bacterium]
MRLDYITIFPDYFSALNVSLVGKAIETGLLGVGVHDLRQWTHDLHRTVDDTPVGGGAGMVMKPEPWGEALDDLLAADHGRSCLIITSPSGEPFTQAQAADLASYDRLLFACGRYEGIDARVAQWAAKSVEVRELSLGDYVLNGGEVAALAMTEAVVRLLPGVIGNPESLAEESYSGSLEHLLEYPVYTKPASWRGLDVPEILLSGHHAKIAQWRHDQAEELTRRRRPDLLGD